MGEPYDRTRRIVIGYRPTRSRRMSVRFAPRASRSDGRIREGDVWFAASAAAASGRAERDAVGEAHAGFGRWVAAVRRELATFEEGDRHDPVGSSLGPDRALAAVGAPVWRGCRVAKVLGDGAVVARLDAVQVGQRAS